MMHKSVFSIVILFLFIASAFGQNLIFNSGFEEGINVGHTLTAYNGSVVSFSGTAENAFEGDSALQIDISVVGTGGPQVISIRNILSGLEAGKKYIFSAVVRGPVGQTFRFRVAGDAKQVLNIGIVSPEYQKYEFIIDPLEPSSDGEYIAALEFAFSGNSSGEWFVDNLSFVKDDQGGPIPPSLQVAYVSTNGSDENSGSKNSPLKTVEKAFQLLKGDTIYLLGGRYHEDVLLDNFTGQEGSPKVITAYPGEEVTFDGTIPIQSEWTLYRDSIYKTSLDSDIWQVFVDGKMMNLCRWPNVKGFIEDQQPVAPDPLPLSLWDQAGTWGHSSDISSNGIMIDDGAKNLKKSGLDMTGAIAVLNVGSFKTSAAPVTSHTPGDDWFAYDTAFSDPFLSWQKPDHAFYYLEGKLNLLDNPGEWYYDKNSRELYLFTVDGSDPSNSEVRGKVQSYSITLNSCSHVKIEGIRFFGTTIRASSSDHLEIEDCTFSYPSYSKRILGAYTYPEVTKFENGCEGLIFRNNIIQYSEGEALHHEGKGALIENNLFRYIDFSCVNLRLIGGTVNFKSDSVIFRNNTIYVAGASETITPGSYNILEGNEVWSIGHLQNDGSIIQYMVGPTIGSVTRYNWLHDCVKMGTRYDGSLVVGNTGVSGYWEPWGTQTKGMVYKNTIWNVPTGMMIKGDYHVVVNNTVVDCEKVGIAMINPDPDGANQHSICKNNLSEMISGYRGGQTPDAFPIPGDHSNNWNGYYEEEGFSSVVNDYQNRDFRPVRGNVLVNRGSAGINSNDLFPVYSYIDSTYDIGAYEYGDTVYNIGGRREALCSFPIPPDGGTTHSDDVMLAFRPAYKADSYMVFLGEDSTEVSNADRQSNLFVGEQKGNVVIPGPLFSGEKMFWRIDAVSGKEVRKGKIWSFTAGLNANIAAEDTLSEVQFILMVDDTPVENAEIDMNGSIKLSDNNGRTSFYDLKNGIHYSYTISHPGFEDLTGEIDLVADTIVILNMIPTGMLKSRTGATRFWLYPNPAIDQLIFECSDDIDKVMITDTRGSRVYIDRVEPGKNVIDISFLEHGIYFIQVVGSNYISLWKKFIKAA